MDMLREKSSSFSMLFGSSSAFRDDFESVKNTMLEGDFSLCSNNDFRYSIVDLIAIISASKFEQCSPQELLISVEDLSGNFRKAPYPAKDVPLKAEPSV